jgi:hypothetical protein
MIDAYKEGVPGNGKPFPDSQDGENSLERNNKRRTPVNNRARYPA